MITQHQPYMNQALELARKGRYTVSPNPMVGCVIVKDNHVIGTGYHQKAGESHAEVFALEEAGEAACGATVYVTLEPCAHHGRTPPCVDALINAKVAKVFIACIDPNPLVAGQGIERLRRAGIAVDVGLLNDTATELNQIFFHYITTQRPFVIAKWAMSLDGKTVTASTDCKKISGTESQYQVHELRQQVDAILVGAQTARSDDPELTVRFQSNALITHPIRIVVSRSGILPSTLKIFDKRLPGLTIIALGDEKLAEQWESAGVETIVCKNELNGDLDVSDLLAQLGTRKITSVLVEGGEKMREQFFMKNLVNRVEIFIAPVIIAGLNQKAPVSDLHYTQVGNDIQISANYTRKVKPFG